MLKQVLNLFKVDFRVDLVCNRLKVLKVRFLLELEAQLLNHVLDVLLLLENALVDSIETLCTLILIAFKKCEHLF